MTPALRRVDLARRRNSPPTFRMESGQSLTELLVFSIVLVPVLLMVPLLGKYINLNQSALEAARYVAWERTVWADRAGSDPETIVKDDAQLQAEIRRRFFSDPDLPIKGSDGDGNAQAGPNPLWFDPAHRPLLARYEDVTAQTRNGPSPGPLYAALRSVLSSLRMVTPFHLNTDGLYTAEVQVKVADVPGLKPFDALGLRIERRNVILTDAWNAGSPDQVKRQVKGLVPTSVLDTKVVNDLIQLLGNFAPELRGLKPGYVAPDELPADRLGDESQTSAQAN